MSRMKRALALTLAALVSCCAVSLAAEADINYEGEIDSFTGLPPTAEQDTQANRIAVTTGADYDLEAGCFVIYQDRIADIYVRSNVLPTMQVTQPVSITGDFADSCQLLRGGVLIENADLSNIVEPGQYLLAMGDHKVPGTLTIPFTIFGKSTNLLESFFPPAGFYITNAARDDGEIEFTTDSVSMTEDGIYAVDYRCAATGISYTLEVGVDHTPPVLALAGVVDGISAGEVSLADLEAGASVSILCNDVPLEFVETLTQQGVYQVTVMDEASNATTYYFTIPIYFDRNSWVVLGMIVLSVAGLTVYLWREKTHMRVR